MNRQGDEGTTILVTGGTGKIGRRVAQRLVAAGLDARIGSRGGTPPFDWEDRTTWTPLLSGARAAFLNYAPDLSVPGAPEAIGAFAAAAVESGVRRLVLLTGRGGSGALESEDLLKASGAEWTVVRCSWFAQNFNESDWLHAILAGELALPVGDVLEPFVDADDIADVAVAGLTEEKHTGQVYELTGPRPMTFADAVADIALASGRDVRYRTISVDAYAEGLRAQHVPEPVIGQLSHLFGEVLDGSNAHVCDGVERALGRPPWDFAEFARDAASSGAW
ncbi:NmrA family transcriptional regulator [Streptomyces sp. NPDC091280]|uniref:NmrA family transcriptional regulator n=1 Tax=Streptomyces sp. NPDC091280 TaxID=3365984 RepID=UPI003809E41F